MIVAFRGRCCRLVDDFVMKRSGRPGRSTPDYIVLGVQNSELCISVMLLFEFSRSSREWNVAVLLGFSKSFDSCSKSLGRFSIKSLRWMETAVGAPGCAGSAGLFGANWSLLGGAQKQTKERHRPKSSLCFATGHLPKS